MSQQEPPVAGTSRLIVVDDHLASCMILRSLFKHSFTEVLMLHNGEACVDMVKSMMTTAPDALDAILLDVEMPGGINGFETCRQLQGITTVPIIFVSGRDDSEALLEAYEAGGYDFILKGSDTRIVLRKVEAAALQHRNRRGRHYAIPRTSLEALPNLSPAEETSIVLQFAQQALASKDLYGLADEIIQAAASYGLQCNVQIREGLLAVTKTAAGDASPLEVEVFERTKDCGRQFGFGSRLVLNFGSVSMLVRNMPADADAAAKAEITLVTLAEFACAVKEMLSNTLSMTARDEQMKIEAAGAHIAVAKLHTIYNDGLNNLRYELGTLLEKLGTEMQPNALASLHQALMAAVDTHIKAAETAALDIMNALVRKPDEIRWY